MKRMLKIMAMLLVIATVVFAAGCSEKADTNNTDKGAAEEANNEGAAANENMTESENVANAPTDTNITDNTTPAANVSNIDNNTSPVIAETSTETPVVTNNTTENVTGNVTHMSNAQRKMAIAQSHQKSSGTQNVSQ